MQNLIIVFINLLLVIYLYVLGLTAAFLLWDEQYVYILLPVYFKTPSKKLSL